jgi:MscS family membrane protein
MPANPVKRISVALVTTLLLVLASLPSTADERHPLESVELSSPGATINALLTNVDQAWAIVRDDYRQHQTPENRARLFAYVERAVSTLDLSQAPPSARREIGLDGIVHLYEILSRIELPPDSEIPDASFFTDMPGTAKWIIPHTEITIARLQEGPRAGSFVFTASTVARAQEFYQKVSSLPYRRAVPIEDSVGFRQNLPGQLIPMDLIDGLPDAAKTVVLGQAVWKLIASAILFLFFVGVVVLLHRLSRRDSETDSPSAYLKRLVVPVSLLFILPLFAYLATEEINLVSSVAKTVNLASDAITYLIATWVAWLGSLFVAELIISSPKIEKGSLNAQLLRLSARIFGIVLGLTIIFIGANMIGIPIFGVLAGVGVGGLAVALAAQDSLKNLLGSLMIFMDQPYKPGQRIVVQGYDGFVEEIGLRSTRLRLLSGAMATIPNETMARLEIENIGQRNLIRRNMKLSLHYETPVAKVEQAVSIVKDILEDHEGMLPKLPPRVFFTDFDDGTLNIFAAYWYSPPRRWKVLAFDESVNLEILRRFEAAEIKLAYPTSTTYLAQPNDQSLQLNITQEQVGDRI